jgi:hypothetical protein
VLLYNGGMPRRIHLKPHLTDDELHDRYRRADDPVEHSHWHFLWLLASGMTATAVAAVAGYSAYWIGQIARRYNADGPDSMRNRGATRCVPDGLTYRPHNSWTSELPWPDLIPRATGGAVGRWPPG